MNVKTCPHKIDVDEEAQTYRYVARFGNMVRQARLFKRWSLASVAKEIGCDSRTLKRFELGQGDLPFAKFLLLCLVMDVKARVR